MSGVKIRKIHSGSQAMRGSSLSSGLNARRRRVAEPQDDRSSPWIGGRLLSADFVRRYHEVKSREIRGWHQEAFEDEVLAMYREQNDRQGISLGLHLRRMLASKQFDKQSALEHFNQSLTIAREIGELSDVVQALVWRAKISLDFQNPNAAKPDVLEGLTLA
jgi:hypothetical protein